MQRRALLQSSLAALAAGTLRATSSVGAPLDLSVIRGGDHAPDNESYWSTVRQGFVRDTRLPQLNNGPGGAVPQLIVDRMQVYANALTAGSQRDFPVFHTMKESGSSPELRQQLGTLFGCDPNEVALTRNAMEALANCLLGFDLRRGDEVLTTTVDYDACISILRQRARRDGIEVRFVKMPAPAPSEEQVVSAFENAITPRTRLILFCHITTNEGQIFPARRICDLARSRNIFTVVDGAHSLGQLDFRISDLNCDTFAGSLHKWCVAPRGTGLLYIRKERIREVWPLFAPYSPKPDSSIEKFEDVGTVNLAPAAVLPELLAYNAAIGIKAKERRLRYMRDRWAQPLTRLDRVRFRTNLTPGASCAISSFTVDGVPPKSLAKVLREKYQLRVGPYQETEDAEVSGIRVSAHITNSTDDVDRLVEAVHEIVKT